MAETKNFDDYTALDTAVFKRMTIRGGVAIFLYSPNVYSECQIHRYDENDKSVKAIAKSGVTYVPAVFFERFLGACVSENGDEITLTVGAHTLKATVGSEGYALDGEEGDFDFPIDRKAIRVPPRREDRENARYCRKIL